MFIYLLFAVFVILTWPIIAMTTSCGTFALPRNPSHSGVQTLFAIVLYAVELYWLEDHFWWYFVALILTLAVVLFGINIKHQKS